MPCSDERCHYNDSPETLQRLNDATRVACEAMTLITVHGLTVSPFTACWWQDHKKRDKEKKRLAAEQALVENKARKFAERRHAFKEQQADALRKWERENQ